MSVCSLQSAVCMYVIKMDTPLRLVSGLITVCDSPPRHPFFADMSKPTSTPVCYVTQSGVVGNHHVCLPSISPPMLPSLASLLPSCQLNIMTQYAPTTHASPSLTKEQWRCIKMNSLPQWDLIHQLLHHTKDSIGHCAPWADSPFKGTGWTYRVFCILKEQFVFFKRTNWFELYHIEFHLNKI